MSARPVHFLDPDDRRLQPVTVVGREPTEDQNWEVVTYSCGHTAYVLANGFTGGIPCAQCLDELLDEARGRNLQLPPLPADPA